jgi:hypothetical protein
MLDFVELGVHVSWKALIYSSQRPGVGYGEERNLRGCIISIRLETVPIRLRAAPRVVERALARQIRTCDIP